MPAMVDEATSQPSGLFSIRRPRIALRMMMKGTGKNTHENSSHKTQQTLTAEIEFRRLTGHQLIEAAQDPGRDKPGTRNVSNDK